MGHALMWVEGLAAMLFLVALTVASSARWTGRIRQLALPSLVALVIFLVAAGLTYATAALRFGSTTRGIIAHDWFVYAASWTVFFLLGCGLLLRRGLRRRGDEHIPTARSWPRGWLALAFFGSLVLYSITLSNMDLTMKMRLMETRTQAGAVLLAMKPPAVPDKDNAAPIYEEAFAALTPMENLPMRWKGVMKAWQEREANQRWIWNAGSHPHDFDWKDKEVLAFLSSQDRGLALLRRAAAKPGCSVQPNHPASISNWEQWFSPPSIDWNHASRLLSLEARVRAANGDLAAALEDVQALLGMARHSTRLSWVNIERRGLEALIDVLHLSAPTAEALSKLSVDGPDYFREYPRMEATFAVLTLMGLSPEQSARWYWDWSKEVIFPSRLGQPLPAGYEPPFWFDATIMPLWRTYLANDDLTFVRSSLNTFQGENGKLVEKKRGHWRDLLEQKPGGLLYVLFMQPKIESNARFECDVTTLRRLTRLALALTAYKAKKGSYPAKLRDLTPKYIERIPDDPWDGGALHYKHDANGTTLFTLRNGGETPLLSPNRRHERHDVVLRLP